jgi:hypothetical protein
MTSARQRRPIRGSSLLLVGLLLAGCGGSDDAKATKTVMPDVEGRQLDVAKSDIKRAGFEDKVEVVGGGTFGIVVESNWKVCKQSPAAGKAITTAPRLTVDRSCHSDATTTTKPPATTASPTTEPTTTTAPAPQEVLTTANNPELAALLVSDDCSDTVQQFAAKYLGRTIEFDGNIAAVANHGDYDTRYDILVHPGDFSETTASGPNFQYQNVGIYDLHVTGTDDLRQGDNVHVKAEVGQYDSNSCLFLLTPVSTAVR